jgi:hypothetical protein
MAEASRALFDEAQALVKTRPEETLTLLHRAREGLKHVPLAHDVLAAKAHLAAGRPGSAIDLLQPHAQGKEAISANLHKTLAAALRAAGRQKEAATHWLLAAEVPRAAAPAEAAETKLHETTLFDPEHKALLVFIPKVACTTLKATVVMNSPFRDAYEKSGLSIHRFVTTVRPRDELPQLMASPDIFRWTVLREPLKRVLSAYLNKIVGAGRHGGSKPYKVKAVKDAQTLAGIEFDPARSITFEEFVRHLMTVADNDMNVHWMPQSRIVGTDLSPYAHVGQMEHLDATFAVLHDRFGYVPERDSVPHLGGAKQHATRYSSENTLSEPYRRLPRKLRDNKAGFPPPEAFYSPELRAMVLERYADDVVLHQKAGAALQG